MFIGDENRQIAPSPDSVLLLEWSPAVGVWLVLWKFGLFQSAGYKIVHAVLARFKTVTLRDVPASTIL